MTPNVTPTATPMATPSQTLRTFYICVRRSSTRLTSSCTAETLPSTTVAKFCENCADIHRRR